MIKGGTPPPTIKGVLKMKLKIKYATILKINDYLYYVFNHNDLVAKFYNKEDAKEFADYLNKIYNARREEEF